MRLLMKAAEEGNVLDSASGNSVAEEGVSGGSRTRARLIAVFAALAFIVASLTGIAPGTPAAEAASYRNVCAPSGKCVWVETSKYCPPGSACGTQVYKQYTGYCSQSWGCFSYKGRNYVYVGGPVPTAAQRGKITQCAANLGFAWLTGVAGGPVGFTIGGVSLALWGCA